MKILVTPDDVRAVGLPTPLAGLSRGLFSAGVGDRSYRPSSGRSEGPGKGGRQGVHVKGIDLSRTDLVVLQRPGTAVEVMMIRALQARGIAVMLDIDDALHAIPETNAAYAYWNRDPDRHWSYLDEAASIADLVTVTTRALARRYAPHGRYELIPNYLPDHGYPRIGRERQAGEPIIIGWSGAEATHKGDLEVVGGALRAVLDENPEVYVRIVGDAVWAAQELSVPRNRLIDAGRFPLADYYTALVGTDIAVVPLASSAFNRAKSWLKAMEYMGAGAHVIASATPANHDLLWRVGSPDLATTEDQWHMLLTDAVRDIRDSGVPIRERKQASSCLCGFDHADSGRTPTHEPSRDEGIYCHEEGADRRGPLDGSEYAFSGTG